MTTRRSNAAFRVAGLVRHQSGEIDRDRGAVGPAVLQPADVNALGQAAMLGQPVVGVLHDGQDARPLHHARVHAGAADVKPVGVAPRQGGDDLFFAHQGDGGIGIGAHQAPSGLKPSTR